MSIHRLSFILLLATCMFACNTEPETREMPPITREYCLIAYMTGYIGSGGEIEGIRNPVLQMIKGEHVRITMVNGETMTHDVTLEKGRSQSASIIEQGDSTSITFIAAEDDIYYCSIPGHRNAGMVGAIKIVDPTLSAGVVIGQIPLIDSIKANFDFEYNTLEDWTATGTAFNYQPTSDRAMHIYESERMTDVRPSGEYFVVSGGTLQYKDTGTLTSVPFEITHPFASFKVAGGALKETRVELVDAVTDSVFFEITGNNSHRLRPVVVELEDRIGQEMYIRLIDREDGATGISYVRENVWAHISFDDFRFYPQRPFFIDELKSEDIVILPPRDIVKNAGLSGTEAAAAMEAPQGFTITLAASEPQIIRPIAFTMDHRGRLWVAESHTYPVRAPEGQGQDKIYIFEDTDGNGTLDKRTLFYDGLNLVSGIEVGLGGVWIGAAPELLYIPIDDSGSEPAGKPEILLDGWGYQDTHETLNSLAWGPDGWLYGTQGVFTHSNVGKPGATDEERQPINAGVWRYHPTKKEFEVFAWGTSNPWGIDFNQYGHAFITACVIPHLYHMVQGGRYQRQAGRHFNPYVFDDIKTIADHVHWVGDNGPHAGNFRSSAAGGGHAHAGAKIFQGAEHWPQEMRHSILMNNIHGYRANSDILKRDGSGYTASHGPDFINTHDSWSQWLDFEVGPGGSMYAIDWYDKNQCHSSNPDVHDKSLGRIFHISYTGDEHIMIDLSEKSDLELVQYQLHPNEWYVRQSRTLLQQRGGSSETHAALLDILNNHEDATRRLRALWTLHVTKGLTKEDLLGLMDHENEYIRSWAIQLMGEDRSFSDATLDKLAQMAMDESNAMVRLYISSVAQRIDPEQRWDIIAGLSSHYADVNDHNLPLMNWYAFEPLIDLDMERAMELAMAAEQPTLVQFTIRKIGMLDTDMARRVLQDAQTRMEDKFTDEKNHEIREELDLQLSMAHH